MKKLMQEKSEEFKPLTKEEMRRTKGGEHELTSVWAHECSGGNTNWYLCNVESGVCTYKYSSPGCLA